MAIRPQAELDEETRQEAFDEAIAQQDQQEQEEEQERAAVAPSTQEDITDEEIEIVDEGDMPEEKEETPSDKVDTGSNLIGALVEALDRRATPAPEPTPAPARATIPQVDKAELRKKFNEKLHETDDPFALVEESAQALVGGTLAEQSRQIQLLKKNALLADPLNKKAYEKWENEVETVISGLPAAQQVHPDAYEYALGQVKAKHFQELVDLEVEERAAAKTRPGRTPSLGSTRGVSSTPAQPRKPRKVAASARDKAEARRYGMTLKNYLQMKGKI